MESLLGWLALVEGDYGLARALLEPCLAQIRRLDFKLALPMPLAVLGLVALNQGNYAEAGGCFVESLTLSRKMGDRLGLFQALTGWAHLAVRQWQALGPPANPTGVSLLERAACLSGAISTLLSLTGSVMFRPFPDLQRQTTELARANLDPPAFEAAFAAGQAMSLDEVIEEVVRSRSSQ
jgi:hypothetical protein